uniref:Nice-3 n=1 Tax=Rhipicephalus appendiculatus TaxID=34631 RepID=A0A131Z285_RHIAP
MADRLSGVAIIICIALGVLTFLLLFIFAKRQIMRFTLKSKHSPHVPIGHGVSKSLKDEVDRRLLIIKDIAYEPALLKPNECLSADSDLSQVQPQHLLRMGVVDKLSELEEHIGGIDKTRVRKPGQDVRVFLLRQVHGGPFANCDPRIIHKFLDLYEHARHSPKEFTHEHYLAFMGILEQLKSSLPSREKTTPRRRDATQPPKSSESPNVNFLSSTMTLPLPDAILPGNNGRPVTEPLASCRPSNPASAEDDNNRDAALETSV